MLRARLTTAVSIAALALGASAAAQAQKAPEMPVYSIVIKDGRIIPVELRVPAGRKIKLTLKNEGPGPSEFENLSLRVEKVLAPGASSFVVIQPLPAGVTYRFIDEFHPETSEMLLVVQ